MPCLLVGKMRTEWVFSDRIRAAAETAPRAQLPEIAGALWKSFAAGQISEAEAEAISNLIEARRKVAARSPTPPRRVGSRPRSAASLDRRRRWVASGLLPPAIAAAFPSGEQAALAVVAAEVAKRGDCRLALGHIAAVAGVSISTVKRALRAARGLGLISVEERRLTWRRNLPNVVRLISPEWRAWNRLSAKRAKKKGGGQFGAGTPSQIYTGQPIGDFRPFEEGRRKGRRRRSPIAGRP